MAIAQYDASKINAMGTERKMYFEGIGVNVQEAQSLETAINVSGLNFEVSKQPLSFMTQVPQQLGDQTILVDVPHPYPNQFATVRTDTLEPLGVVGKDYQILQNIEAFDFLDGLVGDAKFETAGLYGNGAKSFITMSTEPMKILDDEFAPYILFTNSFDGSGAVRVMFTPIRVFCSNALVRAIKNATNKLSIRHSSNLQVRLDNAKHVLLNNTNYLNALKAEAEKLAVTPFSAEAFEALARQLYPVNAEDSEIIQVRNMAQIEALLNAYRQNDLQNFNNTAYKAVQAVADFESHKPVFRQTNQMDMKNIKTVMLGMPLLNMVTDRMLASA
jgi:phage/plasmid-like protein (TIGR03299 family)